MAFNIVGYKLFFKRSREIFSSLDDHLRQEAYIQVMKFFKQNICEQPNACKTIKKNICIGGQDLQ